jgi:hypothetical protein
MACGSAGRAKPDVRWLAGPCDMYSVVLSFLFLALCEF